jgi:hypothetical protein
MATSTPSQSPTPGHGQTPQEVNLALIVHAFHFYPDLNWENVWLALFTFMSLVVWAQIHFLYGSKFMYIIVATGFMEVIGYALRIECAHVYDLMVFVITSLCLLIAPIALALVNYLVAGWLVMAAERHVNVFFWEVSAPSIAKIFLASDMLSLTLQGCGGALLGSGNLTLITVGNYVILAGLSVQIVFFSAYFWIVLKLRFRHEFKFVYVPSLRPLFRGLVITILLLYVRNVYRIVDFSSIAANSYSNPGYIPSHEWTFFVFDSFVITLAMVVYAWYPFNKYLGSRLKPGQDMPLWKKELAETNKVHFSNESLAANLSELERGESEGKGAAVERAKSDERVD